MPAKFKFEPRAFSGAPTSLVINKLIIFCSKKSYLTEISSANALKA